MKGSNKKANSYSTVRSVVKEKNNSPVAYGESSVKEDFSKKCQTKINNREAMEVSQISS